MTGIRICHITTVHPPFDVRIFHKECRSLARAGYDVHLIADCGREQTSGGIHLIPFRKSRVPGAGRLIHAWRAFRIAARLRAAAYHFHDPELLWVGVWIKLLIRAPVIYDVHEDIRKHALGKAWIRPPFRTLLAAGLSFLEKLSTPFFDRIVLAEDSYAARFRSGCPVIHNYPILREAPDSLPKHGGPVLIYVGAIREIRGVWEMLEILEHLKIDFPCIRLRLLGPFYPAGLEQDVRAFIRRRGLDSQIHILGPVPHADIFRPIADADVGLALLHPDANYVGSLPTKMFEYMMMGKPAAVSDFPLWRRIVRETGCGVTVDPLNAEDTARILRSLLQDEEKRTEMGGKGRAAVRRKYNWNAEERKLLACYRDLTSGR